VAGVWPSADEQPDRARVAMRAMREIFEAVRIWISLEAQGFRAASVEPNVVNQNVKNTAPDVCLWFRKTDSHRDMIGKPYRSYIAIGDSLSEGLGDFTFHQSRQNNGWTDRLAGILAHEAAQNGYQFHYANLALRGSKLSKIMGEQLQSALRMQPDLVTVMAGSNDLMSSQDKLPELRAIYRDGIQQLLSAGCDVIVANTINPLHLRVFKPLRHRAKTFSKMIEEVAREFGIAVVDVFSIQDFAQLAFWDKDMVHFSGHGHIAVANRAANVLDLNYRFSERFELGRASSNRSIFQTLAWITRDVIPFCHRKIRGVTSGDGMLPKHQALSPYSPNLEQADWQLVRF
jgi:lysophospholipase L1-like esterase